MDLNTRDDVTPPSNQNSQATSDYKLDKAGRKRKASRIIFNKGEDDGHKQVKEDSMKKTFNNFVEQHTLPLTEEQLDEIVTELQEVLGKNAEAGDWIHDFVHSDNPKFAGKSKEKRKQMALAAYYANKRNESVDYIDLAEDLIIEDYTVGHEKSQFGGYRAKLTHKNTGKVSYLGGTAYHKPEHAEGEAKTYADHYHTGGRSSPGQHHSHDRAIAAYRKKAKEAGHVHESWNAMLAHVKKTGEAQKTSTATKHDVKRTSTGTVYTKQRDADGNSKEFKRDPDQAKRGRGRPKKNSFSEAAEFLMSLTEEQFDDITSEGFDIFFQSFENINK